MLDDAPQDPVGARCSRPRMTARERWIAPADDRGDRAAPAPALARKLATARARMALHGPRRHALGRSRAASPRRLRPARASGRDSRCRSPAAPCARRGALARDHTTPPASHGRALQDRTRFEPAEVEPRIAERWLESGLHHPEPEGTPSENFSIAVPPPNVTGALHMGHALNGSIQDTLIRYHRMRGPAREVDPRHRPRRHRHAEAGRAARSRREGTSREELGREAFVERVWEWREQLRRHDHRAVQAPRRDAATTTTSASRSTRRYVARRARGLRRPLRARA